MKKIKINKDFFKDLDVKIEVDVCCIPLREGFAEDCDCAWCDLQRAKLLNSRL
jgi:hypothetical protein